MGADRTLVDAAFKEAKSRAGSNVINMKPLYDSNTANVNKVFETISGALGVYGAKKEKNRVGVRKQMAAFQAQADALVQGMYAQDEPLPDAFINAFRDKITGLQEEFELHNTYGKGDTEENSAARSRIMGELTRVKNKATNFRAGTEISLAALKDVDTDNKDRKNVAAHMQAFDFENYEQLVADGKIKVIYGENGIEITTNNYNKEKVTFKGMLPEDGKFISGGGYSGEDVTITLASFQKDFKPINIEGHTAILEDINNATLLGEEFGNKQGANISDYNEEEYNAVFTDHVDTKDKFENVVSSKIKGIHEIKSSFKTSLEKNIEIPLSALSNMYFDDNNDGINDMDLLIEQLNIAGGKGSDGSINAEDLAAGEGNAMFEQNMDALIDALTNTDHPAFDIGLSAPMLGAYLGEINKNRYNTAFEKSKKARIKNNEGGVNKKIGNSLITPDVWSDSYVPYIDFLENPVEGSRMQSPRGLDVIYQDGVFKKEVEGEWVEQSLSDLAAIDYIGKYVKGGSAATSTVVVPTTIGGSNEEGGAIAAPRHGGDPNLMLNADTELVYNGGATTMKAMFSGSTIDDGDVDDILSALYPTLKISTPPHLTEKIKINGREFKTDTIVSMDNVIAYLNSPEIQRLISKNANNTKFNSNKKVEE